VLEKCVEKDKRSKVTITHLKIQERYCEIYNQSSESYV